MTKQTSIQLPEVTRRQLYDLAVRWGETDQDSEAKARYISRVIRRAIAQCHAEEEARQWRIHNSKKYTDRPKENE